MLSSFKTNRILSLSSKSLWRQLFVKMDETPNPNFMKFLPTGKTVMESGISSTIKYLGTHDFTAARFSYKSPLAKSLFTIDGVQRVFFGRDYISIGKSEEVEWAQLKPIIAESIQGFYDNGGPLFTEDPLPKDTAASEDDSEAVALIKEIIETRIRPMVQEDGGDIEYISFNEESGLVSLEMKGACTDCPSSGIDWIQQSAITLKNGIERMLVHYVAEVNSVVAVDYTEKDQIK